MEELVNGLLDDLLPNAAALERVRISLHVRLQLVRALVIPGCLDWELTAAEKLNTLRNQFAHHLEPPQIAVHVETFLRALEDPEIPASQYQEMPAALRLKRGISLLCGALHGFSEGYAETRKIGPAIKS